MFAVLVFLVAVISMFVFLLNHTMHYSQSFELTHTIRWMAMFFMGGLMFLLKEHVLLSSRLFFLGLILLVYFLDQPIVGYILYCLMLPYVVLYLAYVPSGWIRGFNRLGDYSYGMYIYAFPVQQAIAATFIGVGSTTMTAIAWPVTLILAMLSWYLVEKPMLGKKDCYLALQNYYYKLQLIYNRD